MAKYKVKMMNCPKCGLHAMVTVGVGVCTPCDAWNETTEQMNERVQRIRSMNENTQQGSMTWARRAGSGALYQVEKKGK
jgi:predicted ATP-dependent serine protease